MMNFSKVRTVRKTDTYTRGVLGMGAVSYYFPGEIAANAVAKMSTMIVPGSPTVNVAEIGSRVRPETVIVQTTVDPVTRDVVAQETVASFIARGGQIAKLEPKTAKGAMIISSVRCKGGRNMANTQLRSLRVPNQFNQ